MIRVKICGMQSAQDVETCVAAGADALGFILAGGPRLLSVEEAAALTRLVPPFVSCVGVFAGTPADVVQTAIERGRLDVLQFSGDEAPEFCGRFGKPTILAAGERMPGAEELRAARAIGVIVDSRTEGKYGGTGLLFDADLACRLRASTNAFFILAGGLTAQNVAEAIAKIEPDAVDVRSGVERGDRKDPDLVRAFIRAAKGI